MNPTKTGDELRCSGRVSNSSGTRRANLVTNPVISKTDNRVKFRLTSCIHLVDEIFRYVFAKKQGLKFNCQRVITCEKYLESDNAVFYKIRDKILQCHQVIYYNAIRLYTTMSCYILQCHQVVYYNVSRVYITMSSGCILQYHQVTYYNVIR